MIPGTEAVVIMKQASVRFYGELNDFLPPERRGKVFPYPFMGKPSVKDVAEALGAPHVEVDVIRLNGVSVGFDFHIDDKNVLEVYPRREGQCVSDALHLLPELPAEPRFVLDGHLGRLAAYLRLLGFDVLHDAGFSDPEIVRLSVHENRIVLTRDLALLKHGSLSLGRWVWSQNPREQLGEVVRYFDLSGRIRPFSRCTVCNGRVEPVSKDIVRRLLEPKTALWYDKFQRCSSCGRIYWEGSHTERLRELVQFAQSQGEFTRLDCPASVAGED